MVVSSLIRGLRPTLAAIGLAALCAGCKGDPPTALTFPPGTKIPEPVSGKGGAANSNTSQGDPSLYTGGAK